MSGSKKTIRWFSVVDPSGELVKGQKVIVQCDTGIQAPGCVVEVGEFEIVVAALGRKMPMRRDVTTGVYRSGIWC